MGPIISSFDIAINFLLNIRTKPPSQLLPVIFLVGPRLLEKQRGLIYYEPERRRLIVNSVWLEIFVVSFFDWSIFGKYGFRLVR